MGCCAKCPRMKRLIREIIAETPAPTPPPEPRTLPQLTGTQMELHGYPVDSFEDRQIINFGITISESPNIFYSNGNFAILKAGTYLINWHVATMGTLQLKNMSFTVTVNGTNYASQTSYVIEGYISGSSIVNASQGDVLALVNTTDDTVAFKQASITIVGAL